MYDKYDMTYMTYVMIIIWGLNRLVTGTL